MLPGVHVAHTLREWMLEVPVRVRIGTACMHPKHPPSLTTRNKTTSLCVTCDDDVVNNFKYTSLKHSLIATVDPRMGRSLRVTSPTFFRYVSWAKNQDRDGVLWYICIYWGVCRTNKTYIFWQSDNLHYTVVMCRNHLCIRLCVVCRSMQWASKHIRSTICTNIKTRAPRSKVSWNIMELRKYHNEIRKGLLSAGTSVIVSV